MNGVYFTLATKLRSWKTKLRSNRRNWDVFKSKLRSMKKVKKWTAVPKSQLRFSHKNLRPNLLPCVRQVRQV